MNRWEYCRVRQSVVIFYERSGTREVRYDGLHDVRQQVKLTEQILAELGLDGWEAYAVGGEEPGTRYYLKRPITDRRQ